MDAKALRAELVQADESERACQLLHAALAVTVPEAIEAGLPLNLPSAMTLSEGETVLSKHKAFFAELERYADDFIVGIIGPKADAQALMTELKAFMKNNLKVELAEEKTGIVNSSE
ncbi:MAG: hypothetical protein Q7Q73_06135, partial [Verrucomicrobiota bacterium JB024]|nr:hypothetical protein [Verrucomicrobiota bacterium JB024]